MTGFVSIVGAGPWDPGLVTVAALDRLRRADVVIVDYLANPALLLHCRPDVVVLQRTAGPRGQRSVEASGAHAWMPEQDDVNRLLVEHARAGRRVVRLKGGDPCMFGRGGEEAEALHAEGIAFELVPGVSSPIAAPECAGIPVTHRHHTPAVTFVSGWEAYEKSGLEVAWTHLAQSAGTIVLMMSVRNARENAARLVEAGRPAETPAAVVRWGTRGIQQTIVGTLADIADRIDAEGLRPPAVMVVGDVVKRRAAVAFMESRPLFGRRIAVTRALQDSARLCSSLAELGADVVPVPALAIAPPEDPEALASALQGLPHAHDGVILSSAHGVDALVDTLQEHDRDVRALAGLTVMAVGRATARACRRRGLVPDIVASSPRTEGMIDALADRGVLGLRWLHVRADEGRAELGDAIEDAGGQYTLAIGYRTIAPVLPTMLVRSLLPPEEGGEGLHGVAFGSGKAARHLLAMLVEASSEEAARRVLGGAKIVAIGPVTAAEIERLGFAVAAVAASPSDEAVTAALLDVLGL
jgi:uroporphyrinogen III methyltransferase/synthase